MDSALPRREAHSDMLVWPRMMAPLARRRETMCASRGTMEPRRARLPAVVCILSAVAMFWVVLVGEAAKGKGMRGCGRL